MSKNTNLSFLTDYITADITNGRIGINNASPTVAFDVSGATRISGALTLTSTISNGTYTYTLPSATGTLALTSAISGTTNYVPKFTSAGAIGNSLIFDNGTTVFVNTTSGGFNTPRLLINNGSGVSIGFQVISDDGGRVLRFQTSDYNNTNTGSALRIGFGAASGNTYTTINAYSGGESVSNNLILNEGGGNVGIGTASPLTKVHIYEVATSSSAYLTIQNNRTRNAAVYTQTTNGGFYAGTSIGTDTFNYQIYDAVAGAARLTISSAGNTSIAGDLSLTPTNSALIFSSGFARIFMGSTEAMRITSGGNVLIGTSTDSGYKLEVAGTMYVTNTFGANSKFSSYSTDGLFGANARPCTITTPGGGQTIRFGYNDYGAGQYWGRMGFAATTNWSLGTIDAAGNNFSIGTDFRGTQLYIYTNGNYAFSGSNVSDSRKKANINYITSNQLENILKLKPASFNQKGSDGIINDNTHTGFIAQDVLDAGIDNLVHGSDEDGYGLDYYGVLSLAVKAIQEQQAQIEELSAEITILKNK
jgi:hypothetical protein